MAIPFQQTDGAMVCPLVSYCSPNALNPERVGLSAINGGAPGSGVRTMNMGVGVALNAIWWEIPVPSALWNAGVWTVRLNVLSVVGVVTLTGLAICRVSAACGSVATIATSTPSIALSAGVQTATAVGVAQTPDVGDKAVVVLGFSGATNSFTWKSDQVIDSPFNFLHLLDAVAQGDASAAGAMAMVWSLASAIEGDSSAFIDETRGADGSCAHAMPARSAAHVIPARCVP